MNPGRKILIDMIKDENNQPITILAAAISFVRAFGHEAEVRIAAAADKAVLSEIETMKLEAIIAGQKK